MSTFDLDSTRTCLVCKQPFERQWSRRDRVTCSPKCRQQAYRNRQFEEREKRYAEARAERQRLQDRADKRNADRRKARKKAKRQSSSKA